MKPHYTNTGNPVDFPKAEVVMNEGIKQLAVKAGLYFYLPNGNAYPCSFTAEECETAYAKFAELIIRECMELTHWKDFEMSVEQRIRLSVYQDIKEHFGVE